METAYIFGYGYATMFYDDEGEVEYARQATTTEILEEFAVKVRHAVVKATQSGTAGYPETVVDGIRLRLGQCHSRSINGMSAPDGPAWYCPGLYGMRLVHLLESARAKVIHI